MGISKETACDNFSKMYFEMSESDKEDFSRVCNKLLRHNFIYGQIKNDKKDYYSIIHWQDEIKNYFSLIDYSLEHDGTYKIFFLKSLNGADRIRLQKMESVLLLLFRKFFYVKGKETSSLIDILITFDDLLTEINKTYIFKDALTKTQLFNSLKVLKRYKLIDFDSNNYNETDVLKIYPTILHVVTDMDLKMINDKLSSYKNGEEGDTQDETSED